MSTGESLNTWQTTLKQGVCLNVSEFPFSSTKCTTVTQLLQQSHPWTRDDSVFTINFWLTDLHVAGPQLGCHLGPCPSLRLTLLTHDCRYGSDPRESARAMRRLETEARRVKHTLTVANETTIQLPSLHDGVDFFFNATRDMLSTIVEQRLQPCVDLVKKMQVAAMGNHGTPKLVLAGGCCRIPKFQGMLQEAIGEKVGWPL